MKAKAVVLILTFIIVVCLIFIVVWQKVSQNKPNAVALSNAIRVKLSVPIIEANMHPEYSIKTVLFQHWEPNELTPKDYNPLHVTKRTGKDLLSSNTVKEIDVYLKKEMNDSISRLRIMSNIIADTAAERKAWLDFDNKSFILDEDGIDSITLSWKIFYLVRKK